MKKAAPGCDRDFACRRLRTRSPWTRFEVTNVTCETVQALIRTEGAVILVYRSTGVLGLPIYDRYVKGQEHCASGEVARGAGVPTTDMKYCPVKKCVESEIFQRTVGE